MIPKFNQEIGEKDLYDIEYEEGEKIGEVKYFYFCYRI